MFFSILSVCHLLPKQLTTHCHDYRVYSNKRRGAYLIFVSPMRRLFEGGAYLKGSYHKDKTFWLYNLIYFLSIFSWLFSRKNWRTRRFWRENWMKERRNILTLNWKTSLLMKIDSPAGLEPHCSDYSVFLSSCGNTRKSAAPELRRLFKGGAY